MNRHVLAACVLGVLGALSGVAPSSAAPFQCVACPVSVFELQTGVNGLSTDAIQQALPTNPLASGSPPAGTVSATGTYTGAINFLTNGSGAGSTSLVSDFFNSVAGSSTTGLSTVLSLPLSAPTFKTVTLFEFTVSGLVAGSILHDDGVSLFQGGVNLTPGQSAPTVAELANFSGLNGGTFTLWYAAGNGNPEQLDLNLVPLPSTWIMLLTAFSGLAFLLYRRNKAAPALAAA
jgi:hypothetical protein